MLVRKNRWPAKLDGDPCRWAGITCHRGHVAYISHEHTYAGGSLPASIGDLTEVTYHTHCRGRSTAVGPWILHTVTCVPCDTFYSLGVPLTCRTVGVARTPFSRCRCSCWIWVATCLLGRSQKRSADPSSLIHLSLIHLSLKASHNLPCLATSPAALL